MARTLFTKDYTVNTKGGYTLLYRLECILNSQNTEAKTSNLTYKVYAKKDSGSYAGNSYVKMGVRGKTSVNTTETELIAPIKITRNDYSSFTELTALRVTGDYSHSTDGTLSVSFNVSIDSTGSTSPYVPVNSTLASGDITVPTIDVGLTYSVLDAVTSMSLMGPMAFGITPSPNATRHTLTVAASGTTLYNAAYTSGQQISASNSNLLTLVNGGSLSVSTTATLKSYNGNTLLGTDAKTFTGHLESLYSGSRACVPVVRTSGANKRCIACVYDGGAWKRGKTR